MIIEQKLNMNILKIKYKFCKYYFVKLYIYMKNKDIILFILVILVVYLLYRDMCNRRKIY